MAEKYDSAFSLLSPPANGAILTSRCVQFTFGDKGKVYLLNESALPATEKESKREGKMSIRPRMKYGHKPFFILCSWVCMWFACGLRVHIKKILLAG